MATEFTGEVIRLALLADDEATIADHHFTDCDIYGPAVVVSDNTTFDHCFFDGVPERFVWRLSPDQEAVIGAILATNCRFVGCRIRHVGLLTPPEQVDETIARFRD